MDLGLHRPDLGGQLRGRTARFWGRLPRRAARALAALVAADLIISVLQLFTGAQLLPRFVVFVSSAILVPVFVLVSGLSGATQRRRRTKTE